LTIMTQEICDGRNPRALSTSGKIGKNAPLAP
jgi:hypothetical protein